MSSDKKTEKKCYSIKSCVGGHDIKVFSGCTFDPSIRKYRGGTLTAVIPYSGTLLSATLAPSETETINIGNADIIVKPPQKFVDVDPIPEGSKEDYYVVSALYVAACKALGKNTSNFLTIGDTVVDENGHVIGCVNFHRNY